MKKKKKIYFFISLSFTLFSGYIARVMGDSSMGHISHDFIHEYHNNTRIYGSVCRINY